MPAQSIPASPKHSCQATAVHMPLQAYTLPFCGQALQICVENLGLSTLEACPVGPGQASIAAREGRAGYHRLTLISVKRPDPIHVPQALAFVLSKSLYPPKPINSLCQSTENCQKHVRDPTSSSRTCILPPRPPLKAARSACLTKLSHRQLRQATPKTAQHHSKKNNKLPPLLMLVPI